MTERLVLFITGEGNWLPLAMTLATMAIAGVYVRYRRTVRRDVLVMATMNLFVGTTLSVMGFGHLIAVMTRQAQGTLDGQPLLLYPIGLAVLLPACLIVRHTRRVLSGNEAGGRTTRLHAWMAATLVGLGFVNLPLAIPALLTIAYRRHTRPAMGWLIVALAVLVNGGLFAGGLLFMLSGARTFEEFQAMP